MDGSALDRSKHVSVGGRMPCSMRRGSYKTYMKEDQCTTAGRGTPEVPELASATASTNWAGREYFERITVLINKSVHC